MIFRIHIHTLCEPFIESIYIGNIFFHSEACFLMFPQLKMLFPEKEHKHFLPGIGGSALEQGDKWRCNGRVSITIHCVGKLLEPFLESVQS